MAKRRFQLTADQIQELISAYSQSRDGLARTRLQAVRLYGTGYPVKEIMDITGCSRTSLMEWCQHYRQLGFAALYDHRLGGNHAKLKPAQMAELRVRLQQYTPHDLFGSQTATADGQFWTMEDLQQAVQRWYGVNYQSRSSYYRLFTLCGFSYQHPARVFKSRREADVLQFEERVEKN
jgi:transposase